MIPMPTALLPPRPEGGRYLPRLLARLDHPPDDDLWTSEDDFYLSLRSSFEAALMPAGSMYHNAPLTSNEAMGPLLESIIVIRWLDAINPGKAKL